MGTTNTESKYIKTKKSVEAYLKLKYRFPTWEGTITEIKEIFNTPVGMTLKILQGVHKKRLIVIEDTPWKYEHKIFNYQTKKCMKIEFPISYPKGFIFTDSEGSWIIIE